MFLIICKSVLLVFFVLAYLNLKRGSRKIRKPNEDKIKKILNRLRHNCKY